MTAQGSYDNWMNSSERSFGLFQISQSPSITRCCISVFMKIWPKGGLMTGIVARGAATSTFVRTAWCTIALNSAVIPAFSLKNTRARIWNMNITP